MYFFVAGEGLMNCCQNDEKSKTLQSAIRYPLLFVCIVALRPKSTAKVMARRSVHLTTLFPGQA